MQDIELRVPDILRYAASQHDGLIIPSLDEEGRWSRQTYAEIWSRVRQLTGALTALGLSSQSCVASLALNTRRHLELYYGVTAASHILHTINPRFSEGQIRFTVEQAGDAVIFFDPAFTQQAEAIARTCPSVSTFIALCDADSLPEATLPGLIDYETFIASGAPDDGPKDASERDGAFLCYTSGTTGDPKGVLYSHRSCLLHALAASAPGNFGIGPGDVVLPCASMYHATAWALPMIAPMNGARLVFPGGKLDGQTLLDLCEAESVTHAWGVPTIWKPVLDAAVQQGRKLPVLKRIFMGGSAVPPQLKRDFDDALGIEVVQVWGMTETSPLGAIGTPSAALHEQSRATRDKALHAKQGRVPFGVELEIVDESGKALPHDGKTSGQLVTRGPWVVNQYFGHDTPVTDTHGWFDTGDVATIDALGYMQITDRTKDIIKSGGEWISSIELENAAVEHPDIAMAAAIGLAHPKWDERPLLIFARRPGSKLTPGDALAHLSARLPKWWVPEDAVVAEELPLTATGKVDKKSLRKAHAGHYQKLEKQD